MSSASSPAASSAASRAKAVPKTKKKPPPPSPSSATSQQSPSSFLLSAQAQAISSDSEGSLDDIVFDNTGEFFLCVLSPAANLEAFLQHFPFLFCVTCSLRKARSCPVGHSANPELLSIILFFHFRCLWALPVPHSLCQPQNQTKRPRYSSESLTPLPILHENCCASLLLAGSRLLSARLD